MRRSWMIVPAAGLLASACANTPAISARISVRDSAGIEIVESVPPARTAVAPWVIDSVPVFDIGADQSDPHQDLSSPSDPLRLRDGRVVLADHGTQEIRFFDQSGKWLRSVGRKGEGPGEFTDLGQVFVGPGDSLFAYERGTGLVSVLDAEGRYARRVRPEFPGKGRFASFGGVFATGRWLVDGSKVIFPTVRGVFRSTVDLFEYSAEGKLLDSIASLPGWESYGEPVGNDGFSYLSIPFGRESIVVVRGPRAFAGVTERVDFLVYRSGVGVERVIRIQLPERPLTREMVERAVNRTIAEWGRGSAEEKETYRRKALSVSYPAQVPAIDALFIAESGELWLREYTMDQADPVHYVVADSSGRWKAFAVGPRRFRPSWIGQDLVIGLWRDADDVPHVRAYRLAR